jgi:hypothetical protein
MRARSIRPEASAGDEAAFPVAAGLARVGASVGAMTFAIPINVEGDNIPPSLAGQG